MYHGLYEIVEGFTKNAHAGFGRSTLGPLVVLPVILWIGVTPYTWPVLAALYPELAFAGAIGSIGASLGLVLVAQSLVHWRLGFPLWPVLVAPIATVIGFFVVLRSLNMVRKEGVVRWRGRE